jgi:hypothetical protein
MNVSKRCHAAKDLDGNFLSRSSLNRSIKARIHFVIQLQVSVKLLLIPHGTNKPFKDSLFDVNFKSLS